MSLHAPAGTRPTGIVEAPGETVLPNGRLITPRGTQVKVAPHPYGLALSPDGRTLVTVNSGTAPFSVSVITNLAGPSPRVVQIPPGFKSSDADPQSVFLGAAIAPDNRTLYVSEGNNGRIGIFDLRTSRRLGSLALDGAFEGKTYQNSLTGELALSPDGRTLFGLDMAHFRLVAFDAKSGQMTGTAATGFLPLGLALSPDGRWAYVSNAGMFRYLLVPGYDDKRAKETGIDFPAFGFPSPEARQGVVIDGKQIPGLGDPNAPGSNSLWVFDVSDPARIEVKARIPTGTPVGPLSVGGSSPGAVVASRESVYVSNATQDSITFIDARTRKISRTLRLEPASSVKGLRGVLPFGMALGPGERRLYVACAGINAVAVVDTQTGETLGYIPAAWFPARVTVSQDGTRLFVANAKGLGSGPNGGSRFQKGPEGTYIGDITKGLVSIIDLPPEAPANEKWLAAETARVLANNGFAPAAAGEGLSPASHGPVAGERPIGNAGAIAQTADPQGGPAPPASAWKRIHHVVFVVKENRTFDQVFGDLPEVGGERVDADPSLAEFGEDATVKPEAKKETKQGEKVPEFSLQNLPPIEHARVTPNHHALARRFGLGDNFYVDSDVSVDGHHWLVGNYPNEVVEAGWPAAYGSELDFVPDPDAPGRLAMGASNPWPESYLEAGSLWEHLVRHRITFRNYGEGMDSPGDKEDPGFEPTGVREAVNTPMPEVLFENTSRSYPTFNTNISDQYRFQQFKREFELRYASGKQPLPQLIYIWLPDDHTADPRPAEGYPYRASYVADNDLALGNLVSLLSHSAFWKDMAIFVTEDDAQDGSDHVDAHRSLLLVISPYSRRGAPRTHASMASILKTFDLIFGLPYLNQYDAAATDLGEWFTDKADFTPYGALPPDTRVFDPAKVVESGLEMSTGRQRPSERLDDPAAIRRAMRRREEHRNP